MRALKLGSTTDFPSPPRAYGLHAEKPSASGSCTGRGAMKTSPLARASIAILIALASLTALARDSSDSALPSSVRNLQPYADPAGFVATYSVRGQVDTSGAFFRSLGA